MHMQQANPYQVMKAGHIKTIHHNDNIVINNIQLQFDRIQKAYEQQAAYPESESDNDMECEDITEQDNTQTHMYTGDSGSESD